MPKKPLTFVPKVSFVLRRKRARSEQGVFLIFRLNGDSRLQISTHVKALPSHWDLRTQRFKTLKDHPEYEELNRYLDEVARTIKGAYIKAGGNISADELKRALVDPPKEEKRLDLFGFIDSFLQRRGARVDAKRGTEKVLHTVSNLLREFAAQSSYPIDFETLNLTFCEDFKQWLYRSKNHSVNYVGKVFSVVRQFMRAGFQDGHSTNKLYEHPAFVERSIPTPKIALTLDELDRLRELKLDGLEAIVRDYFLIGCYTGMRYSDYSRITRDHVSKEEDETLIRIYTRKTNTYCVIPCFPELLEILERYDYQLPKAPVNQIMNRYLKGICRMAGVNKSREV